MLIKNKKQKKPPALLITKLSGTSEMIDTGQQTD